jgi:hypothetical protein
MANITKWIDWCDQLQFALIDAGHAGLYDNGEWWRRGSDSSYIFDLYEQGLSPEEVVVELEDRAGFTLERSLARRCEP